MQSTKQIQWFGKEGYSNLRSTKGLKLSAQKHGLKTECKFYKNPTR